MDRGILRQTLIGFVCKYPNGTHFDLEISSMVDAHGKI